MEVYQFDTKYAIKSKLKTGHICVKYDLEIPLKCIEKFSFWQENWTLADNPSKF